MLCGTLVEFLNLPNRTHLQLLLFLGCHADSVGVGKEIAVASAWPVLIVLSEIVQPELLVFLLLVLARITRTSTMLVTEGLVFASPHRAPWSSTFFTNVLCGSVPIYI